MGKAAVPCTSSYSFLKLSPGIVYINCVFTISLWPSLVHSDSTISYLLPEQQLSAFPSCLCFHFGLTLDIKQRNMSGVRCFYRWSGEE